MQTANTSVEMDLDYEAFIKLRKKLPKLQARCPLCEQLAVPVSGGGSGYFRHMKGSDACAHKVVVVSRVARAKEYLEKSKETLSFWTGGKKARTSGKRATRNRHDSRKSVHSASDLEVIFELLSTKMLYSSKKPLQINGKAILPEEAVIDIATAKESVIGEARIFYGRVADYNPKNVGLRTKGINVWASALKDAGVTNRPLGILVSHLNIQPPDLKSGPVMVVVVGSIEVGHGAHIRPLGKRAIVIGRMQRGRRA